MNFVVFRRTTGNLIVNIPKFCGFRLIPVPRSSQFWNISSRTMSEQQTGNKSKLNRLAQEKSPYLLQHSENPVDWYPWGEEAFKKARELNRPIFLSVGYSTCHWCHVMEHESFENEGIAQILNENFVSIKVDREERPDVDKIYMSFVQSLTGGGGWPMSVFLTPDLEPITGGTYFPPVDSLGRLGFPTVLKMIADKWKNNGPQVREQGRELATAIREGVQQKSSSTLPNGNSAMQKCFEWLSKKFDSKNGGFGAAPKFPKAVDLDFLLCYFAAKKGTEEANSALGMLELTLGKMCEGGIHDHVGRGFHRYSVDSIWHVPHFEKMLYDQGQLLRSYSNFYKITGQFGDAILDIAEYIHDNLTHPLGGFYSAEDADSLPTKDAKKKKEGAFCVWTKAQVERVLGDRASRHNENVCLDEIAEAVFQIGAQGNVPPDADPHGELTQQNVLHLVDRAKMAEIAKEHKMSEIQLGECILDAKRFLAEERTKRPKPHLDDKIITAWNGLAISGLCAAAQVFPEKPEFGHRAEKAVGFIRTHLLDQQGELLRSVYVDQNERKIVQINSPIRAFADDFAFLIEALLDLYSLNFDENLVEWAKELQEKMDSAFWDGQNNSGYFMSRADDSSIISRMQDEQDGAEPCANSVAVSNLLRLSALLDSKKFRERAEMCFRGAAQRIDKYPFILPRMLISLNALENPPIQIILVGQRSDEKTKEMLRAIQAKFIPMGTKIFIDNDKEGNWLLGQNAHLGDYRGAFKPGRPSVFICREMACEMPIHSVEELKKRLDQI